LGFAREVQEKKGFLVILKGFRVDGFKLGFLVYDGFL
jgi:hypothetical protein